MVGELPKPLAADSTMASRQPVIETVYRKLGGRKILGEEVASEADLARIVARRIPLAALAHFKSGGFSEAEIERFIIPGRTRRHREARKESLTVEESDRLVRLARIQAMAEDVFGDEAAANRWLREPLGILGGQQPIEAAQTESGGRVVERILAGIDWGAAA
jgi:putative toxin-antitoxin system antitoxin component (TIGR02293 family)